MSWNYRVIQLNYDGEVHLQVHEVYYDEAGLPNGYTERPVTITSNEEIDGLNWVLDKMKAALLKPVLTEADFVNCKE